MSGHNKWTQIKRQKGAEDAKKSKLFSLLARAITMEAKRAGGNLSSPALKTAVEKARKANMPNDNIERAIKRATGEEADSFEEVLLEAYTPGGAAFIIEGITDSKNRTVQEVKHLLSEQGASLAAPGSALWAFEKTADGWSAKTKLTINEDDLRRLEELIAMLENHDDIKNISTNADLGD